MLKGTRDNQRISLISLAAVKKFGVATENSPLDATSLSVEGEYKKEYPTVEILKSGAGGSRVG